MAEALPQLQILRINRTELPESEINSQSTLQAKFWLASAFK